MLRKLFKLPKRYFSRFISIYLALYLTVSPALAFATTEGLLVDEGAQSTPVVAEEETVQTPEPTVEEESSEVTPEPEVEPEVVPEPKVDEPENDEVDVDVVKSADGELEVGVIETTQCLENSLNPCIGTDKEDYAPHEVVTLRGHGYLPESRYLLIITSANQPPVRFEAEIITNSIGGFNYSYQLDGRYRPDYAVEVRSLLGDIIATDTFTDSRTINSATVNGVASITVAQGTTILGGVNVSTNGSGNNDDWASTGWRISTSAPGGVSCDNFEPDITDDVMGATKAFNMTAPNTPGIYNAYFIAYNNDSCSGGASAVYVLENAVTVTGPDLTISKSNDVGGVVNVGGSFNWIITVKNEGTSSAIFNNEDILSDSLPNDGVSFVDTSDLVVTTAGGVTGSIDCDINSSTLVCDDNSGGSTVVIPAGGSFTVTVEVIANEIRTLSNPRKGGKCEVDPNEEVAEQNEHNNKCNDSVKVNPDTGVTNPPLGQFCGLDIALVLDNSTSISSGELTQMKAAMTAFTSAFNGTPTEFSVSRFATTASVVQSFTSNITAVNAAINGIPSGGGYTNWEDGLFKGQSTLTNRPTYPDLMIFASDGNPNRVDNGTDASESQAVSEAKIIANNIKTAGVRILALGIGDELDTPNLQTISGNNVNTGISSDVITSDFATLAADLADYAIQLCGGTINVKKLVDGNPAANWVFTIDGDQHITGADGFIPSVEVDNGTYSVVETPKNGFTFQSAVCTINNQSVGSPITNGVGAISVDSNDIVTCTFNNITNAFCGDGVVNQQSEQCDSGASNGIACTPTYANSCNYCSNTCQTVNIHGPYCGDGIKNGPEQCDGSDGVSGSDFACTQSCELDLVEKKVMICHATSSNTNPYVSNEPAKSADVAGHDGHNGPVWSAGIDGDWGDIIPPFNYVGGSYPGKNWTAEGQAIWNNQCEIEKGTIVVQKTTVPAGNQTNFDVSITGDGYIFENDKGTVSDSQDHSFIVEPGTYSVEEDAVSGWEITGNTCDDVTVANGETKYCQITNTKVTDVSITKSDTPDPVLTGGLLTYIVTIENESDTNAENVVVTDNLPAAFMAIFSVIPSQGSCSDTTLPSPVVCELGTLAADASATIEIKGLAFGIGSIENNASVTTSTYEIDLKDNTTVEDTTIVDQPSACVEGQRWASSVVSASQGLQKDGSTVLLSRSVPASAIGLPDAATNPDTGFYSLGKGGSIVVAFTSPVVNGEGTDISIHEVTNGRENYPEETASVEVSTDNGGSWHNVGSASSLSTNGVTLIDIAPYTGVTHVRVTDTTNFNLNPNSNADGFDLDAVDVDCKASITVIKDVDINGDGQVDKTNSTDWAWDINGSGNYETGSKVDVQPGSYVISESQKPSYHVVSLVCGQTNYGAVESQQISVSEGEELTCTFTNSVDTGSVKVNKRVDLNGDGVWGGGNENSKAYISSLGFSWTLDAVGSINFGDTVTPVITGAHQVNENSLEGYHFVAWYVTGEEGRSCTNPNGTTVPVDINVVKNSTAEITLCNARDMGQITIVKDSVNNDGKDFNFSTSTLGSFILDDDGNNGNQHSNTKVFNVPSGAYWVRENSASGWKLTDLVCIGDDNSVVDIENRRADLDLDLNENITCTFTNTKLAEIKGTKFNDRNGDNHQSLLSGETWMNGWKIFIDENHNSSYDTGELTDTTSGWFFMDLGKYDFEGLLPGTYTVCEQMQEGWYASGPVCREILLEPGDRKEVNFGNHQSLRIIASKIVCNSEDDLPNWGSGAGNINSNTATNFVANNPDCQLVSDWQFQWGYDGEVDKYGNGDQLGLAPEPWQILGSTDASGVADIEIMTTPEGKGLSNLWVRESLMPGYVAFSYPPAQPEENPYSAEMYCHKDVLYYDNFDRIEEVKFGETYYCVAFNALKTGDITVTKEVVDPDGNPVEDTSTLFTVNLNESNPQQLTDGQSVVYGDLPIGTYTVTEDPSGNYTFDSFEGDENSEIEGAQVTVTEEGNTNVKVINKQIKGKVIVHKDVVDANFDSEATSDDLFEVVLGGEGLEGAVKFISDAQSEPVVAEYELNPGEYSFTENNLPGYNFLGCYIEEVEARQVGIEENVAIYDTQVEVELGSNQTKEYTCVNQAVGAQLQLEKTNNVLGVDQIAGNVVQYTLTVTAPTDDEVPEDVVLTGLSDNPYVLEDVKVVDLTPEGFTYVNGTWTASSDIRGDIKASNVTTEPTYASPGTWNLGDMVEGEVVTLTYLATISNAQDAGLYKDLAWTQGTNVLGNSIYGTAAFGLFAGTQVNVIDDLEEGQAEVLGVSLPNTGANIIWAIFALASFSLGVILVGYGLGKKSRKISILVAVLILLGLVGFSRPEDVYAASSLAVRIEQPEALSNDNTIKVGFVALDLEGRDVSVQCLKKGPGDGSFVDFGTTINLGSGGNSGDCNVGSAILNADGTYEFKVEATAEEEVIESEAASMTLDTVGPDMITGYEKSKNACEYTLNLTTASDGQTSAVQIFRSTERTFVANSSTLVVELPATPGQVIEYVDNVSNCNLEYFYAIRALDNADNSSDFVADSLVEVTPGVVDEDRQEGEDGEVAGSETESDDGAVKGEADNEEDENQGNTPGEETKVTSTGGDNNVMWIVGIILGGAVVWLLTRLGIIQSIFQWIMMKLRK